MPKLTHAVKSVLNPALIELVKDLIHVGNNLRIARCRHTQLTDVMSDINESGLGFKLRIKERVVSEPTNAHLNPLLKRLGLNDMIGDETILPKATLRIKSEKYKDIKIDGAANYRDGQTNANWAVYKSVKSKSGKTIVAALYVPSADIMYLADEKKAYTLVLAQKGIRAGAIRELNVSSQLQKPFTAEYGSWHKSIYSIPKSIFTVLVRENVGGSIRESGMQQLPLIWAATGERGLAVIANVEPDADPAGTFIAQKAGVTVSEIAITSDVQGRRSVFAIHPQIAEKVLDYFHHAMEMTEGWIKPEQSKIRAAEHLGPSHKLPWVSKTQPAEFNVRGH